MGVLRAAASRRAITNLLLAVGRQFVQRIPVRSWDERFKSLPSICGCRRDRLAHLACAEGRHGCDAIGRVQCVGLPVDPGGFCQRWALCLWSSGEAVKTERCNIAARRAELACNFFPRLQHRDNRAEIASFWEG